MICVCVCVRACMCVCMHVCICISSVCVVSLSRSCMCPCIPKKMYPPSWFQQHLQQTFSSVSLPLSCSTITIIRCTIIKNFIMCDIICACVCRGWGGMCVCVHIRPDITALVEWVTYLVCAHARMHAWVHVHIHVCVHVCRCALSTCYL